MRGPQIWCPSGAGLKVLLRVCGGSFSEEEEGELPSATGEREGGGRGAKR
jgi:hypothetical protein